MEPPASTCADGLALRMVPDAAACVGDPDIAGIARLHVADFGLFTEFRPAVQQMRTFRQYNGNNVLACGLDELGNLIVLTRAGNYQLSGDELNLVK